MDRDEMIEEIAKITEEAFAKAWDEGTNTKVAVSEAIYNAGYRKQGMCKWRKVESKSAITEYKTECGRTYYANAIYPQYFNGDLEFCPFKGCGNRIEIEEKKDG